MTDNAEKFCIACGMSIQSQAKKCQHCHTWQTEGSLTFVKPISLIVMLLLLFVLFGGIIYDVYSSIHKDKVSFSKFQNAIVVIDSKHNFFENESGTYITCIGNLKNNSNVPWKDLRFEVQFFNKSGELIDTIADKNYGLVLPPHTEVTFRVRDNAACKQDQYTTHKVFIRWAEKAK